MTHTDRQRTTAASAAWLPLVPRPRPPGRSLDDRISDLRALSKSSGDGDQVLRAAEVCNAAALIASDCGIPDLARVLCWRQHKIFDNARPLPGVLAKLALQPVLNLPRQLIREGHAERAYTLLETLHVAARDQADTVIDGHTVHLQNLAATRDGHKAIRATVWAALLADGTRALMLAGRWQEASQRAEAHHGIGARLLDGRQVTILALAHGGQADRAIELLDQSTIAEPWERAIQRVLRIYCRVAADITPDESHVTAMLAAVVRLLEKPDPLTVVFSIRLALAALDLARRRGEPHLSNLRARVIAAASNDAYTARDALAHPLLHSAMTADQRRCLTRVIHAAGLGMGTIHEPAYSYLMAAVSSAEEQLRARCPA